MRVQTRNPSQNCALTMKHAVTTHPSPATPRCHGAAQWEPVLPFHQMPSRRTSSATLPHTPTHIAAPDPSPRSLTHGPHGLEGAGEGEERPRCGFGASEGEGGNKDSCVEPDYCWEGKIEERDRHAGPACRRGLVADKWTPLAGLTIDQCWPLTRGMLLCCHMSLCVIYFFSVIIINFRNIFSLCNMKLVP